VDPFFDLSLDPLCIATLDGHFRRVNAALITTLGHPGPDLLTRTLLDLLHPEDRPAAGAAIAGLARGKPIVGLPSRFSCACGNWKWLAWSATPFVAEGLAYIVAHDHSAPKPNVEDLRQSEARCVCELESVGGASFVVDREWRLIRANGHAERVWMRRRQEVLGRHLREVFPEAAGGPFHDLFDKVARTGAPAHLEERFPCAPSGRWFEVHAYPCPEGLTVYFRDVSGRHLADEKIKSALQEKEVLLREVHHRVKNNLQVICSMLRLQERNFRDDTLLHVLRECRERVLAMAMLHDQLHRAKDFSNIGLGEYIQNLAASLFCSYGVNSADLCLRLDIEDIPVAVDTAIPCGLIVNELVSNALRHAFPDGRRGGISLGLHARPGGSIELTIDDDGRGFTQGAHAAKGRSLGLWLVDLLASQIGAAVERSSIAGTQYRFVFSRTACLSTNPLTGAK
jgi:PAS domain S-box-containing protein